MKRILGGLLVIVLLLSLITITVVAEERETENYSMVVFTKGAEYFNWCYAGMQDAAKTLGNHVNVELQGPSDWDASQEARTVEQVLAKRPNGIIISCADESTLIPVINRAIAGGVPIICFDSDSPDSDRLAYVGTDNHSFGAVAGKAIIDEIGTEGEVAILLVPGAVSMEERSQGCVDYLKEHAPNIKINYLNDEGDVSKAEQVTSALLQANPNVKAVFSTHGYGAPGAAAATRNLGKTQDICIIGSDYDSATLELLKNKEVTGTVIDDPYLLGYQAMMLVYASAHPTDVLSARPPFGHVPELIYGNCSLLTAEILADEHAAARYEKPPIID
jgi:ribose transport system substrate-binding protein